MNEESQSPHQNQPRPSQPAQSRWIYLLPWMALAPVRFSGSIDDHYHRMLFQQHQGTSIPLLTCSAFFPRSKHQGSLRRMGHGAMVARRRVVIHSFRPLSALTHWVDYQLWPNVAWMHHTHSFIWLTITLWAFKRLLITVQTPTTDMAFAILLFAVEDAHALAAGWIANRSILLCACFALLSPTAHIRWRKGESHGFYGPSVYYGTEGEARLPRSLLSRHGN